MSSIRRTNFLPVVRAHIHASSAVRRFPRCRSPLGEGAKRPTPVACNAVSPIAEAVLARVGKAEFSAPLLGWEEKGAAVAIPQD